MSDPPGDPGAAVGFRFPRSMRLCRPGLFREAFGGRQVVGRHMVIWIRECDDAGGGRLGVIASKRTFPHAVMRNRAKRLLREAFRLERQRLGISADLVLVGRRRLLDAGLEDVRRELVWLTRKAGLVSRTGEGRSGGS